MNFIGKRLALMGLISGLFFFATADAAQARNYFISPKGDNSDGLTWKTAYPI
ncbi:MAG: hypothetical protein KGS72_01680 [Cyanobacteria bacterium REEB67]|nr:hypothetical protein [Cyanobacteria bacterium REEB67]